jgi:putative selenium metabolism protein SsnA
MVDLLIKDGLVVTMDETGKIISGGSVGIEDGKIAFVKKGCREGSADEVIDAKGKIVMPGLICSHTHLYGVLLRGVPLKIEPPADFWQILQRIWWQADEVINKEDAYASALVACLEFIKSGTTFFADTFSGPGAITGVLDKIALAVEESGIRGMLAFESTERRGSAEGAKGMKENERFIRKVHKKRSSRVMGMVSIYAPFTVSDELLYYGREMASRYRVPLTINVSESLIDVYHSYMHHGKRTVERLNAVGVLKGDVVLAHCVHVNEEELEIVREAEAKIAHNPMSNMLNAVGVAPVPSMLKQGIQVGLGNDGYIFDGFENIRAAYLIHKVASRDPRVITPREVLEMATIRGAELYGLEEKLGSIQKGKFADLIIIDPSRAPTPVTPTTVLAHLVDTTSGSDVETVIVGGRVVMRERKVQTISEEHVVNISRKAAKKLWQRMGKRRR